MNIAIDSMKILKNCTIAMLTIVFLFGTSSQIKAEDIKVNLTDLIKETQKTDLSDKKINIVWWLPEGFWRANFDNDKSLTKEQRESFIAVLRPFILLMVIKGEVGTFAGVTYKSEEFIRRSLLVLDNQGLTYSPIPKEEIHGDAKNFLSMMKPLLSNMLGPMGANMHMFLFPAEGQDGELIANASEEGSFVVRLGEREFKWRLPLGSLLAPKYCPRDKEEYSGAWKYCPIHGSKLKKVKKSKN